MCAKCSTKASIIICIKYYLTTANLVTMGTQQGTRVRSRYLS